VVMVGEMGTTPKVYVRIAIPVAEQAAIIEERSKTVSTVAMTLFRSYTFIT
jgi:hypothetical protein